VDIYIVDTNLLFSAIISPDNDIAKFILERRKFNIDYYAPKFLLEEIKRHRNKIKQIADIDDNDLNLLSERVFKEIIFIEDTVIPFEEWIKALRLVRDIDPDDSAFVALNNLMDKELWTGDIQLYKGLKSKGYSKVVNFQELKNRYGID
jgi:predicted nucleic acid-binding protein